MKTCLRCGARVGSSDSGGLCAKCLIEAALIETSFTESDTSAETAGLAPPDDVEGDVFGPYQIVRVLGEGGMGTVYLAEQREPIRRRVALKVVKLGMDTNQVLARFSNERQALAMLDHSNIARIFEAGATSKGRPYFAMEYIDGPSITDYCDRHRLTTKERLELFLPVCCAVQYAHQRGLIHRDIKPSNVLVTEENDRPVPKVIDFGISKAIEKGASDNTLYTQFGQMVGTPEYASPEQADVIAGKIGASSDVYSFGVLLYELLIGAVPFDSSVLRKSGLAEMLRIIREEDRPTLSRRLSGMGQSASDIAAKRRTDPVTLQRLVDGDLNWITMRALEKNPDQRYASLSDLAADIERHLAGRPILAGAPGKAYRARKFLRRHKPAVSAAAAALILVLLAGGALSALSSHIDSRNHPKLTDKDTILLGEFANGTSDPVFDGTLRQGLAVQLEQSPFLSLVSEERLANALRLAGRRSEGHLTPELTRDLCERIGGAAVIEGSISMMGNQYVLGLRARNCRTGDVLDQQQEQAVRKEDVLGALSKMARKFRSRVGESLATIDKHSTPLPEATTPSLDALKSFSAALSAIHENRFTEAVFLLNRAVELDPEFAMAHAYLGRVYSDLGEAAPATASTSRAYQFRARVSDPESFFIGYNYHRQVTRNLEMARQICESWAQRYPREMKPHGFLAGFTSQGSGLYEKSSEEGKKAIGMDPEFTIGYADIGWAYVFLNRLEEAEAIIARAPKAKTDMPDFSVLRYFIAFLRGDKAAMEREAFQRQGKSEDPAWNAQQESLALAYEGRRKEATALSRRAVDLARQAHQPERAAIFEGGAAVWEAMFGNRAAAKEHAEAALRLSRGRDADYAPAIAFALVGYSAPALRIADELEKQYPEDTCVRFQYLPALKGILALKAGNPAKAIELTQAAVPYELAVPGTNFYAFFGSLYAAYVRGLAYLELRRYGEAGAAFRKILDNRGIVLADPVGAMARLQIGRVLRAADDKKNARAAYEQFLHLWGNAEPDIPVLRQAKAELAAIP